jgi:poly(beta-D-mannuronate) lyase
MMLGPLNGTSRAWPAACVLVLALAGQSWAGAQSLRSPYAGPAAPAAGRTTAAFGCPAAPPAVVRLATGSVYQAEDPARAEIDEPAQRRYLAEIAPAREFTKELVKLTNDYRRRAVPAVGRCALGWLKVWAETGALTRMDTVQAKLGRGPLLAALALGYLQLAELPADNAAERAVIETWLARLAEDTIAFMESRPEAASSRANHRYWNGLGVAAAGIAGNRRALFDWGIASYRIGLEQIEADGVLPLELKRGKRARDYHLYAVAPLVMLAELGAANGLDLYGERGGALHRLVRRVVDSLHDAAFFEARSGTGQTAFPGGEPPSNRLAWLEPYLARFPDAALERRIARRRPLSATHLGGNLTLLFDSATRVGVVQETTLR